MVGIGSVPNSELFRETLVLSKDGGILTDSSLRTSHPSGDVFAAGDVACAPVPLGGNDERNFMAMAIRSQHVKAARDMGTFAARTMLAGSDTGETYNPVPHMYSRSVLTTIEWRYRVQRSIQCAAVPLKLGHSKLELLFVPAKMCRNRCFVERKSTKTKDNFPSRTCRLKT